MCLFGCRAKWLHVVKDETIKKQEWRDELWGRERSVYVTYHLYCICCKKRHNVTYARVEKGDEE